MSQGPKKKVFILQEGGFTHAPLTLLIIRVVLLLSFYGELNPLNSPTVCLNEINTFSIEILIFYLTSIIRSILN